MSDAGERRAARRADRLMRAYPRIWRARYGDEMAALLIDDILERPRSWRRSSNVIASALLSRMRPGGALAHTLAADERARVGLATAVCAAGCFVVFSAAVWAQITVGWQWSAPDTAATFAGMVLISAGMYLVLACAAAAAVPLAWRLLRTVRDSGWRAAKHLIWPTFLLVAGAATLFIGGRHFGNGWPGTYGHPWPGQGIVPGGLAAFTWASTLSITAYWAHPSALVGFPKMELAWMAISPVALVAVVTGAGQLLRRIALTSRVAACLGLLLKVAAGAMVTSICGAWVWIIDGGAGPRGLFHSGVVDFIALAAMSLALLIAVSSLRLSHHHHRSSSCAG